MEIDGWPEAQVPSELRIQVWDLQRQAWPGEGPDPGVSHDPALRPWSMLLLDGGRVLAALDLLSKEIVHAGQRFQAFGLSTVVTDRAYQGRGCGRQLVAAARQEIRRRGADLGIFTCDRPLQAFYESAGWSVLPGAVLVGGTPEHPFPSDQFDKVTMADFFTEHALAHREKFRDARIELFPGAIDRLW